MPLDNHILVDTSDTVMSAFPAHSILLLLLLGAITFAIVQFVPELRVVSWIPYILLIVVLLIPGAARTYEEKLPFDVPEDVELEIYVDKETKEPDIVKLDGVAHYIIDDKLVDMADMLKTSEIIEK